MAWPEARGEMSPADLKKLKVLVLDPNAYMRGVLGDSLRRLHLVNISSVATSAEAFVTARTMKPDIIFTDWEAGKMSGLEFTREVRRNQTGVHRETPIILLASLLGREQLNAARQAGVNEILLKPVSAQSILSRVEEVTLRPRRFIDSRSYVGPCRRRREDPEYEGPWRRLTDDPLTRTQPSTSEANAIKLRAIISQLSGYLDANAGDRQSGVRGMYRLLLDYAHEVSILGDDVISRVWKSALRYIEGVGMTETYDPDVIRLHFQSIARILDMPDEARLHRVAVATDLEKLVTKKVHSAAGGAVA